MHAVPTSYVVELPCVCSSLPTFYAESDPFLEEPTDQRVAPPSLEQERQKILITDPPIHGLPTPPMNTDLVDWRT